MSERFTERARRVIILAREEARKFWHNFVGPVSTALVGARTPAEVDANDAGAELTLTADELATIDTILAGVAGRVREFTPLRPAMEPWGEEIPAPRV